MDYVFKALADATRRELLDRLKKKDGQTLSELCEGIKTSRQSVSKHLNILEEVNLVSVVWQGREKLHFLNPIPIREISRRWVSKYTKRRADALLDLKQSLEEKQK
ncbi:MAG: helix-turn-helix domain-containing protein [Sphingomonadales bacterium]